jgi:LysR family nitrogen assimilation transcriptional regulator
MLELELQQTLLVRNGRGALPTEAGKLLLDHSRGLLHQATRIREDMARARGALAGRVALGLPPSVARVLTVPLMRAFRQDMPQAQLSISEALSASMQEGLLSGRLDLAVLYENANPQGLEVSHLLDEELVLVQPQPAAAQSGLHRSILGPITMQDVAQLPLVIPSRPNAIRMHVESEMARMGHKPLVALEIDGISAILDLVQDQAGSAILPRNAVVRSLRPNAFSTRAILASDGNALAIRMNLACSALRPSTLTQQSTMALLRRTALQLL